MRGVAGGRRGRRLVVRFVVVALAGLLLAGTGVASAQYVPGQPGFILDPDRLPDTGGQTTIRGVGCPPDTPVFAYILVDGAEIPIGSGRSADDIDGGFEFVATVPPLPAGEYTVIVRCGPVTLSNILTIFSTAVPPVPEPPGATGTLPRTGSDALDLVRWALLLVAVGGLFAISERQRRRRAHAT